MPKIKYVSTNFQAKTLELVSLTNSIITDYNAQGYDLTLRQVYYQLVSRGYIPNNERSYKNLGNVINDGRLAGLIDWNSIIDRTRNLRLRSHWENPSEILRSVSEQYFKNLWEGQENYVEVWVEKDALVGVIGKVCDSLDVPYFSCRGYVSQSEMWSAAQRFIRLEDYKSKEVILHLGDHDPSGIDMSRDIQDRLSLFGASVDVQRIALNIDQVRVFSPPPNPTKVSDARAEGYLNRFGEECWELDALEPSVISSLIKENVEELIDFSIRDKVKEEIQRDKNLLRTLSTNWGYVCEKVLNDLM